MAPLRRPYCPHNWPICRSAKILDQTGASGQLLKPRETGAYQNPKKGGKKTWSHSNRKLTDFTGQRAWGGGLTANWKDRVKEQWLVTAFFTWGFYLFISCLLNIFFLCLWTHVKRETLKGTSDFIQGQRFPAGRDKHKQMKMLEICLKLVGCKSKKGLSSSSSCYLEGKRMFVACRLRLAFCRQLLGMSRKKKKGLKAGKGNRFRGLRDIARRMKDEVWQWWGLDNIFCTVETEEWGVETKEWAQGRAREARLTG